MKDLTAILRGADPAAGDPGLSPVEVAEIRRSIVDAASRADVLGPLWQLPLALAALVVLTVALGAIAGRNLSPTPPPRLASAPDGAAPAAETRQLQFSTPGGTRIIWVFDSEFKLEETIP